MNRFLIDHHPDAIAKALCDQHIVKMPLEEAQMLCTAVWFHRPDIHEQLKLYKPCHINTKYHEQNKAMLESSGKKLKVTGHPCTLWAMETQANYAFAYSLYTSMLCEYHHRYGKWHGAGKHSKALNYAQQFIPEGGLTPHPQCFSGHDDLKTDEDWPIVAYRAFYKVDKMSFARYNKGRDMPEWMKENCND